MFFRHSFVIFISLLSPTLASQGAAEEVKIVIITEIRNLGAASIQVGMKSTQTIKVDTAKASVSSEFKTGVTNIGVANLPSLRNGFTATNPKINKNILSLSAKGQTASFVSIMGDIDYNYTFRIDLDKRRAFISGCHNEFPS